MEQLRPSLRQSAELGRKLRLGVLPLEDVTSEAKRHKLGRVFSDILAVHLSSIEAVELVERQALDKVAEEIKLGLSGAIDPKTAKKMGAMLAADALLSGSVAELGDYFDVSVRIVEVEAGKVLTSAVVDIEKESVTGAKTTASVSSADLQTSLDILEFALVAYARGHIEGFQVHWPASLTDLTPKYLDRLPNAQGGTWVYDAKEGRVWHSARPELKPTQPRIKLQGLLDENRKEAIKAALRVIATGIKMYQAESGELPKSLSDLRMELPNGFGGSWVYDAATGSVSHSQFPSIRWTP